MITPSIKALRTLPGVDLKLALELKAILLATRDELKATTAGAARHRECYHAPLTSDLRLHCLNAALGTHGVEFFETARGEKVSYLNAGDPYIATIVHFRGHYRVTCWGDIAERHGSF